MRLLIPTALIFAAGAIGAVTVQEAKQILADGLKDPDSVKFRNVKLFRATGSVCGEYNAKNSYGGYVGYTPFGVDKNGNVIDVPDTSGLNDAYVAESIRAFWKKCEGQE